MSAVNQSLSGIGLICLIAAPWLTTSAPHVDWTLTRLGGSRPGVQTLEFAFSPHGHEIAITESDHRVALRSLARGGELVRLHDSLDDAWRAAFSPAGRLLALGGYQPDVVLCDLSDDGKAHRLGTSLRRVNALCFSPDGKLLAAAGDEKDGILLWDMARGREHLTLKRHGSPVIHLAFGSDGRTLVSGATSDAEILVWDVRSGKVRRTLTVPPAPVLSVAYSPDGTRIAAVCGFARQVKVWDLSSGRIDDRFGQRGGTTCVAFTPDGTLLATAESVGIIRFRHVGTARQEFALDSPATWIHAMGFSPDGNALAACGGDGQICLWTRASVRGPVPELTSMNEEVPNPGQEPRAP